MGSDSRRIGGKIAVGHGAAPFEVVNQQLEQSIGEPSESWAEGSNSPCAHLPGRTHPPVGPNPWAGPPW